MQIVGYSYVADFMKIDRTLSVSGTQVDCLEELLSTWSLLLGHVVNLVVDLCRGLSSILSARNFQSISVPQELVIDAVGESTRPGT